MTDPTRRRACRDDRFAGRTPACLWALLALTVGCADGSRPRGSSERPDEAPPIAATTSRGAPSAAAIAEPSTALRRPARRYYIASAGEKCEMYWEQGDERGVPEAIPCPREISGGERIRLAGRVCLLERHERAADQPVRCPASLVTMEALDREDGGTR